MLNYFEFYRNSLSGTIPSQLGGLSQLTAVMSLYTNKLSGQVPTEFGKMTSLTSSMYEGERERERSEPPLTLRGAPHPPSPTQSLPPVSLGFVSIHRPRPTHALAAASCRYLHANSLSGTFPTEMGKMSAMTTAYYANNNEFTGTLPTELGNLMILTTYMLMQYVGQGWDWGWRWGWGVVWGREKGVAV